MPYVITELCTKETACTEVCPVDAIHPLKDAAEFAGVTQLFIDPDTCIECGSCEAACPVTAIFQDVSVPAQYKSAIQKNADHYK